MHGVVIVEEAGESEPHLLFFCALKCLNLTLSLYSCTQFVIYQLRQAVCVLHEDSPFTPYTDTQPWQVHTKRRIKPYTEPHIPTI